MVGQKSHMRKQPSHTSSKNLESRRIKIKKGKKDKRFLEDFLRPLNFTHKTGAKGTIKRAQAGSETWIVWSHSIVPKTPKYEGQIKIGDPQQMQTESFAIEPKDKAVK